MHVCLLALNLIVCRARQAAWLQKTTATGDKQSTEMHLWGRHSTNWHPWDKQSTNLFPPGTSTDGFATSLVPSHWNLSWNLIILKAKIFIDVVALAKGVSVPITLKLPAPSLLDCGLGKVTLELGRETSWMLLRSNHTYACIYRKWHGCALAKTQQLNTLLSETQLWPAIANPYNRHWTDRQCDHILYTLSKICPP